jgi:hypothetical protein
MEAKPSCRHISCPRIAQAFIDFISAKHVGSTATGPTKARKPRGKGVGRVQPHGSKAFMPPHLACPRIAQAAFIDFISAKHVGSTAMGPTKARKPRGKGVGRVQPHGSKAFMPPHLLPTHSASNHRLYIR